MPAFFGRTIFGVFMVLAVIAADSSLGFSKPPSPHPRCPRRIIPFPILWNPDASLTPSELVGKYIWFCASASNARFFSYIYPQGMHILID